MFGDAKINVPRLSGFRMRRQDGELLVFDMSLTALVTIPFWEWLAVYA